MKLTDLFQDDQNTILARINREKEVWERSNKIDNHFYKNNSFLENHFAKFSKFYEQVTEDQDIESAFCEWSGQNIENPDLNKINVPQFGFWQDFSKIVKQQNQLETVLRENI